jgi:hypothetical protein
VTIPTAVASAAADTLQRKALRIDWNRGQAQTMTSLPMFVPEASDRPQVIASKDGSPTAFGTGSQVFETQSRIVRGCHALDEGAIQGRTHETSFTIARA